MSKTFKFIFNMILMVILVLMLSNKTFAAIDMNLIANSESNTSVTNSTANELTYSNSASSSSTANSSTSVKTGTMSSLPESELGLTNILNILLITVVLLLILLSIAIIIKLKK